MTGEEVVHNSMPRSSQLAHRCKLRFDPYVYRLQAIADLYSFVK